MAEAGHGRAGDLDPATVGGFARLAIEARPKVLRFLQTKGIPSAEAHDLCQEVLLVAWSRRRRLPRPESFLYGVATRLALAYHRAEPTGLVSFEHLQAEEIPSLSPAGRGRTDLGGLSARSAALSEYLDGLLVTLSPRQREVLVLVWLRGLGRRQAAEELGIAEGTLRYHEKKALDRLKKVAEACQPFDPLRR